MIMGILKCSKLSKAIRCISEGTPKLRVVKAC